MTSEQIEKATLLIQIKGQVYQVHLPHEEMLLVVKLASSLTEGGTLNVTKAEGIQFQNREKTKTKT